MLPDTFWIVVTQYDTDPNAYCSKLPRGPIVHETYCLTEDEAERRARSLAGRHGWATILKVDGTQVKPPRPQPSPCEPSNMSAPTAMPDPRSRLADRFCSYCGCTTGTCDAGTHVYCYVCKNLKP